MIIVEPSILSLDPGNSVTIVLGADGVHGISGNLVLEVKCKMTPRQTTDVRITLDLLDTALYSFEDGSGTLNFTFRAVSDGNILKPIFKIRNLTPPRIELRINATASEVNQPSTSNTDFRQFPVIAVIHRAV